jgi:hypothetical protein
MLCGRIFACALNINTQGSKTRAPHLAFRSDDLVNVFFFMFQTRRLLRNAIKPTLRKSISCVLLFLAPLNVRVVKNIAVIKLFLT